MNIAFSPRGWDEYLYWQNTDKKIASKINALLKDVLRNPFEGLGKPEPLKHPLSGYWSRRVTDEHRLVYKITADAIIVAQCRSHY
jgi:toxin YoeB